jgi:elongation factor Ts
MAEVTIQLIKELRDRTGVGMGACKKALVEASGDLEQAITNLRKAGMATAAKKESRSTNEGLITFGESSDNVALVEINAETDFVVKNDRFQEFSKLIADEVAKTNPASLDDFLKQTIAKDGGMTVDEYRTTIIQTIGENIQISRLMTIPKSSSKSVGVYSHMGGKIVVAVEIEGASGAETLAKDVAMHVAAASPEFVNPEAVPGEILEKEKEIIKSQIKGKPENIIDKIIEGKIKAYYKDHCLTEQLFVKDDKKTVSEVVTAHNKDLKIAQFIRWNVGE